MRGLRFRRARSESTEEEQTPDDRPPINQWTEGSALTTKAVSFALSAALVCGPVGLVVAGFAAVSSATPPSSVAAPAFDAGAGDRAAAGELAQRAVVAWLTTPRGQEDPSGLLPSYVAPETPFQVGPPTIADVQAGEKGVWSVTVAITVANEEQGAPTRYFVVPVQLTGGSGHRVGSVLALPAAVAGPAPARGPALTESYRFRLNAGSAAWQSSEAFLQALAAGQGDITRYTTPGQELVAIQPAPYASVVVTEVSSDIEDDAFPPDGRQQHVLVSARATDAANRTISLTYALTLQARGNRWEISAINPTPRIASGTTLPTTALPHPAQ